MNASTSPGGRQQPNVLVIITDQQRADHTGFGGNAVVRTPNLDALAASGVVFDRAHVANPVCSPNRASILTGRMPSSHGVIFNDRALEWGTDTFVRRLRSVGYRTGLFGKSHLQLSLDREVIPDPGPDATRDGFGDEVYHWEFPENFAVEDPLEPDDYYGFDTVRFASDHGARMSSHHLLWALAKGARREDIVTPVSAEAPGDRRSHRWWQVYRPPYEAELHSTAFVGEQTLEFIEDAHAQDRPWMAWMSFPDPHHPLTPPGEWFERHRPEDMPLPVTFGDPLEGAPPHIRRIRARRVPNFWVLPFGTDDPELVREALAATYAMVEFVDHEIGRVLDRLRGLGIHEDTVVVFTSDHGDMMGDHSLMLKGSLHYRGVIRVPLVIAGPGIAAGRTSSLTSSLDLCPTVLDICGVDPYRGIQGTSLRQVLEDPSTSVRDHLLIEDDLPPVISEVFQAPQRTRTLVTGGERFTRDCEGAEQMFDLLDDPDELHDLAGGHAKRRGELLVALVDASMAADDVGRGIGPARAG